MIENLNEHLKSDLKILATFQDAQFHKSDLISEIPNFMVFSEIFDTIAAIIAKKDEPSLDRVLCWLESSIRNYSQNAVSCEWFLNALAR